MSEFVSAGFTLRGSKLGTEPDFYGLEYVYSCDEAVAMSGSKWTRHRNAIRRFPTEVQLGPSYEMQELTRAWSACNGSVHQNRLLKSIFALHRNLHITRTYIGSTLLGFSVVDMLTPTYGVILQRLANPRIKGVTEPSILLHYNDCVQFKGCTLNIGSSMNLKGLDFAKRKLNPSRTIQIFRSVAARKISKSDYDLLGNT